jgi:hypothetical protein
MNTSGAIQQAFPWADSDGMLCAPMGTAPPLPPLPHSFQVHKINVSGDGTRDRWETFPTLAEARAEAETINRTSANWRAEVTA